MNGKNLFVLLLLSGGLAGGWFLGRYTGPSSAATPSGGRKVLLYQSPMHPWIKSDRPGNCTICGMKLVPVYEGDQPLEAADHTAVRLSPSSVNVVNVGTEPARMLPVKRTLRVGGTIDDDDTKHRRLSAYVDGRVERLGVRYVGAEVREGDLLARIYSPAMLTARDEYILVTRQTPSPQRDRLLAAARERLIRLGLSEEQVSKLPSQGDLPNYLEILAPMSGTVVSRNVYEGQYVKEGDVLFEIADFSKMWFIFNAYERDLAWIEPGQMVEVKSPTAPGKSYRAPIDFIDPNLDPATRSAKVRVILDNPLVGEGGHQRRELLHKTYADGEVSVESKSVLTIPRAAVLLPGGEPLVYVAKEREPGSYSPRRIKLGRAGDDVWEVVEGLNEGELIVTTGNLLIDAQAQLDHGGFPEEHSNYSKPDAERHGQHLAAGGALTEEQRSAASDLLKAVDSIGSALSADDLGEFNSGILRLASVAASVTAAFGKEADWVTSTSQLSRAPNLAEARKDFYPFSKAVAEFTHALRQRDPQLASVRIFECPMVKDAVPNAPERKGRWVQIANAEVRNPFFGAEMLDCGVEVKP